MKQLFPVLIAIIATTMILVMYMNKDGRQWSTLDKEEQQKRMVWLILAGVIILSVCTTIFLLGMR